MEQRTILEIENRTVVNSKKRSKVFMDEVHPIVSIIYFICVMIIVVTSMNPYYLGVSLVSATVFLVVIDGIDAIKKRVLMMIMILFITIIIQPLFNHRGVTVLLYINSRPITLEVILYGIALAVLLFSSILWFACCERVLTTDKIMYLFGNVVPSLALIFSMSLRLIPMLRQRYIIIDEAQAGIDRPTKKSIKKFVRNISVLISWSLEETIETSDSMIARGYGLKGRSNYNIYMFQKRDKFLLAIIALFAIGAIKGVIEKSNVAYYYPGIYIPKLSINVFINYFCFIILVILPILAEVIYSQRCRRVNSYEGN